MSGELAAWLLEQIGSDQSLNRSDRARYRAVIRASVVVKFPETQHAARIIASRYVDQAGYPVERRPK